MVVFDNVFIISVGNGKSICGNLLNVVVVDELSIVVKNVKRVFGFFIGIGVLLLCNNMK